MKDPKKEPTSRVHRVDGRLHLVHHVTDDKGNSIATVTGPLKVEFRLEDLGQLVAGACVMALPVALTEEVWNLGETLSIGRALLILGFSILVLAGFIWGLFYGNRIVEFRGHFLKRAVSAYMVTFLVALFLNFDYSFYGILLILCMYILDDDVKAGVISIIVLIITITLMALRMRWVKPGTEDSQE